MAALKQPSGFWESIYNFLIIKVMGICFSANRSFFWVIFTHNPLIFMVETTINPFLARKPFRAEENSELEAHIVQEKGESNTSKHYKSVSGAP